MFDACSLVGHHYWQEDSRLDGTLFAVVLLYCGQPGINVREGSRGYERERERERQETKKKRVSRYTVDGDIVSKSGGCVFLGR